MYAYRNLDYVVFTRASLLSSFVFGTENTSCLASDTVFLTFRDCPMCLLRRCFDARSLAHLLALLRGADLNTIDSVCVCMCVRAYIFRVSSSLGRIGMRNT